MGKYLSKGGKQDKILYRIWLELYKPLCVGKDKEQCQDEWFYQSRGIMGDFSFIFYML